MQNFFEKLASNLVFAAFIPAVVFTLFMVFVFGSLIPSEIKSELNDIFHNETILIITIATIISFVLLYLREFIYAVYRGIYIPRIFSCFESRCARYMVRKINRIEEEIKNTTDSHREAALKNEHYALIGKYSLMFGSIFINRIRYDGQLLPTRFGNILFSGEYYCMRYGINAVAVWPRLMHVIPRESMQKIEEISNQMFLILNFSLLSFLFSGVNFVIALSLKFRNIFSDNLFFVYSLVGIILFYIFYKLSLPLAISYATMYRSAFDLYRFNLLMIMKERFPQNSDEEIDLWDRISQGFTVSECYGKLFAEYTISDKLENKIIASQPTNSSLRFRLAKACHRLASTLDKSKI